MLHPIGLRAMRPPALAVSATFATAILAVSLILFQTVEAQSTPARPGPARPAPLGDTPQAPAAADTAKASKKLDLQPSSFQGITPGSSTASDVRGKLGAPIKQDKQEGLSIWTYKLGPFPTVEFLLEAGKVSSIVIHLQQPAAVDSVAQDLGLSEFLPTEVRDDQGTLLGQAYPDRGVIFSFAADAANKVGQIVLDPITSEPFMLRVTSNLDRRYKQAWQDLQTFRQLEPDNDQADLLTSRLALKLRLSTEAWKAADRVIQRSPNIEARMLAACAQAQQGDISTAINALKELSKNSELKGLLQAELASRLGDTLLVHSLAHGEEALQQHQLAIKLAKPFARADDQETRRRAKQILVDAHLGIGQNIAWGNWKSQDTVVPKWLDNAAALAESCVKHEAGDPMLQLVVQRRSLNCYQGLMGKLNPVPLTQSAMELGKKLALQPDPYYRLCVQRELGAALVASSLSERDRGNSTRALVLVQQGIAVLEPAAKALPSQSAVQTQMMGEAYFACGSLYALVKNEHSQATVWFRRAITEFSKPGVREVVSDIGLHGERFVSMGVSLWEAGQRRDALKTTTQGAEWMEQAVSRGLLDKGALGVPYDNLARMYGQTGNTRQAQILAARAAQLEGTDVARRSQPDLNR